MVKELQQNDDELYACKLRKSAMSYMNFNVR